MNDYAQQLIVAQRINDLHREADNDRLARRARVRRDGSISFTRKIGSVFSAGFDRLAEATHSFAAPNRSGVANG